MTVLDLVEVAEMCQQSQECVLVTTLAIGCNKRALEGQVSLSGDGWSAPGTGRLSAERDEPVNVP